MPVKNVFASQDIRYKKSRVVRPDLRKELNPPATVETKKVLNFK